mgnify:CR=1 FL=1
MAQQFGAYKLALTATTATTGGAAGAVVNPEGVPLIIKRAFLYVATPSGGAATVDVGIGATATTSNDTLIDGKSVATAGVFDNITDKGTNGKERQLWPVGQYITVTASATLAGLVGALYIDYIPAA